MYKIKKYSKCWCRKKIKYMPSVFMETRYSDFRRYSAYEAPVFYLFNKIKLKLTNQKLIQSKKFDILFI